METNSSIRSESRGCCLVKAFAWLLAHLSWSPALHMVLKALPWEALRTTGSAMVPHKKCLIPPGQPYIWKFSIFKKKTSYSSFIPTADDLKIHSKATPKGLSQHKSTDSRTELVFEKEGHRGPWGRRWVSLYTIMVLEFCTGKYEQYKSQYLNQYLR